MVKITKIITPDEFRAALGRRIRQLREDRGSEQRDFAKAIGISQGMLSRIENGRSDINIYRLRQIALALGTTAAKLLEPII